MDERELKALIKRRRLQILVHSIIYYRFSDNIIDDATWSAWALELEERKQNTQRLRSLAHTPMRLWIYIGN